MECLPNYLSIFFKSYFFAIVGVFFICINNSLAQDSTDVYELTLGDILFNTEVTTASKTKLSVAKAPATIYVFSEDQIKQRGYRNLQDLMEDIPEIEIQKKAASEASNFYSLRGIGGNEKMIVLMDGFRINSQAATPHVVGYNYSLVNAKRVEVILGPASALYGIDAFSGIINIITKSGEEMEGFEFTSSVGNFNTTDNNFSAGFKGKDLSFILFANFFHSAEPDFQNIYEEEFSWYNHQYLQEGHVQLAPFATDILVDVPVESFEMPTNAYSINAKLNFNNFQVGFNRNSETHSSSAGMRPEFNLYKKDAVFRTNLQTIYLTHHLSSESAKWSLQSSVSLNTYELDNDSNFQNTFTSYNKAFKYAFNQTFKFEEQFNYQFSSKSSLIIGGILENITALPKTGDLPFKYDKKVGSDKQNFYYLGTNTLDKSGNDLTILQDLYFLVYQNYGGYVQYQSAVSEVFNITLGTRYDYNTRFGGSFNPRLGLVLTPNEKMSFKLLYGEAFLAPSPYKAYQHYGSFIPVDSEGNTNFNPSEIETLLGPFWHLINPDLKPEKLRTIELNTSFLFGDFLLSLNGYYNNIDGLIVIEQSTDSSFKGYNISLSERPVNKGLAKTYGGTVRLDWQFINNKFKINPNISYSYSDGDIDGSELTYSAQNTIKGGVDFRYDKFSASIRGLYRSESIHGILRDLDGGPLKNDSYFILNLSARYSNFIDKENLKTSAFVRVTNLTNKKYFNLSFGTEESLSRGPQDPFRINFGFEFRF